MINILHGSSLYDKKYNNDQTNIYITFLKDILPKIKIDNKTIELKNIKNGKILFNDYKTLIYIFNDNNNKYLLKFDNNSNLIDENIKKLIEKNLLMKIYFDININYKKNEDLSQDEINILNEININNIDEYIKKLKKLNKNNILAQDYNNFIILKKNISIYNLDDVNLYNINLDNLNLKSNNMKITLYERYITDTLYDDSIDFLFNNIKSYDIKFKKIIIDKLFNLLDFYKKNFNDFIFENNDILRILNFNNIDKKNIVYKITNNDIEYKYMDYLSYYNYNNTYMNDIINLINVIISCITNIDNNYESYILNDIKKNDIKDLIKKQLEIDDENYISNLSNKILYYMMIIYKNTNIKSINYIENNENIINNIKNIFYDDEKLRE